MKSFLLFITVFFLSSAASLANEETENTSAGFSETEEKVADKAATEAPKPANSSEETVKELEKVSADAKKRLENVNSAETKDPKKPAEKVNIPKHVCWWLGDCGYKNNRHLVKGEVANIGSVGLTPKEDRFAITSGLSAIDKKLYGLIRPEIFFATEDKSFSMNLMAPFRLEIFDKEKAFVNEGFNNAGKLRAEDWDQIEDFAQTIGYLTYGRKEDNFFLDINSFKSNSIGHGTIMKRYNPNINLNEKRASVQMDAYNEYLGFEAYTNSFIKPTMAAGIFFIKPFALFTDALFKNTSIGFTYVSEFESPIRLGRDDMDIDRDGVRYEIEVNPDDLTATYLKKPVMAYGIDVETKIYLDHNLDIKTYFDLSFLQADIPDDGRSPESIDDQPVINENELNLKTVTSKGFALGGLFRYNLVSDEDTYVWRTRLESRMHDGNYLPSYFNTFHEMQKLQYYSPENLKRAYPDSSVDKYNNTKAQEILSRDKGMIYSFYFETSFGLPNNYAIAAGNEFSTKYDNSLFLIHLEKYWESLKFIVTYMKRNYTTLDELMEFGGTNTFFIFTSRWDLFDVLTLDINTITPFIMDPGQEEFLSNVVDFNVMLQLGFPF